MKLVIEISPNRESYDLYKFSAKVEEGRVASEIDTSAKELAMLKRFLEAMESAFKEEIQIMKAELMSHKEDKVRKVLLRIMDKHDVTALSYSGSSVYRSVFLPALMG